MTATPEHSTAPTWLTRIVTRSGLGGGCPSAAQVDEVRRISAWLASRASWGLWAGWLSAFAASLAGLVASGLPLALALPANALVWVGLLALALGAWLQPEQFTGRRLLRTGLKVGGWTYLGSVAGYVVGQLARHGWPELDALAALLLRAGTVSLAVLVVALAGLGMLMGGVAQMSIVRYRRALARLALEQERDDAARRAAVARLKLLQAQIQPHFIFNTLAALQHWVDEGDARAPALLRSLTAFLRRSTELLGRDSVSLGEEFAAAGQYLQIMQARLGERLRTETHLEPGCATRTMPPGLLLTLVENAVEHGIAPTIEGGTVQVDLRGDASGTTLTVRDDGAGLAPNWRDGTGLAICRERLRHHGSGRGTLSIRSLVRGTEAVLHLPEAE